MPRHHPSLRPRSGVCRSRPSPARIPAAGVDRQAEQDAPKPMKGFAGFLRQDLDAVTAGLTLPWSSGVVEGHVNRVKTLKRAMYGRASFELLRTRILSQP
ncbi:transposase [Streptomyces tendae]